MMYQGRLGCGEEILLGDREGDFGLGIAVGGKSWRYRQQETRGQRERVAGWARERERP
jgi:hypothetical protein